jgi:hypothetical protein
MLEMSRISWWDPASYAPSGTGKLQFLKATSLRFTDRCHNIGNGPCQERPVTSGQNNNRKPSALQVLLIRKVAIGRHQTFEALILGRLKEIAVLEFLPSEFD